MYQVIDSSVMHAVVSGDHCEYFQMMFVRRQIQQRQDAVSELCLSESASLALLKALFHKLPDLEKKLCSVYHRKVFWSTFIIHSVVVIVDVVVKLQSSPGDFYHLVRTLIHVSKKLDSFSEMALSELKSELLLDIIREVSIC